MSAGGWSWRSASKRASDRRAAIQSPTPNRYRHLLPAHTPVAEVPARHLHSRRRVPLWEQGGGHRSERASAGAAVHRARLRLRLPRLPAGPPVHAADDDRGCEVRGALSPRSRSVLQHRPRSHRRHRIEFRRVSGRHDRTHGCQRGVRRSWRVCRNLERRPGGRGRVRASQLRAPDHDSVGARRRVHPPTVLRGRPSRGAPRCREAASEAAARATPRWNDGGGVPPRARGDR